MRSFAAAAVPDHIDLYYPHRVDRKVPIRGYGRRYGSTYRPGKIRATGLSEAGPQSTVVPTRSIDCRGAKRILFMTRDYEADTILSSANWASASFLTMPLGGAFSRER